MTACLLEEMLFAPHGNLEDLEALTLGISPWPGETHAATACVASAAAAAAAAAAAKCAASSQDGPI